MCLHLSGCPGTWGIEDANDKDNTPWNVVLDEIAKVGYRATELGPFGYLPQNGDILSCELTKRNLFIVAGTLYDDLVSKANLNSLIEKTYVTCKLLSDAPKFGENTQQFFVLIDMVKPSKKYFAGQPKQSCRLAKSEYDKLVHNIREISKITNNEFGIKSVIHHHAGGFIEFEDEIDNILSDVDRAETGLCFDTGHAYYSGIDPSYGIKKYAGYIDYVHFKDIDANVYRKAIGENIDFYKACEDKVMCPIGDGCLDYRSIKEALNAIGYKGFITVEQDRAVNDTSNVVDCIKKSIKYLMDFGFEL